MSLLSRLSNAIFRPRDIRETVRRGLRTGRWVRYVRFIDGFRKWFNKRNEDDPIEAWDEQPRRLLKNELRWIVDLYQRL